jgi:ribonuclease HII
LISKKADRAYPIVSAASCVAKHLRDQSLRDIECEWNLPPNCLGQGYPNETDTQLMKFFKKYQKEIQKHQFPFIRYTWAWPPLQKIIQPPQNTIDEFLNK